MDKTKLSTDEILQSDDNRCRLRAWIGGTEDAGGWPTDDEVAFRRALESEYGAEARAIGEELDVTIEAVNRNETEMSTPPDDFEAYAAYAFDPRAHFDNAFEADMESSTRPPSWLADGIGALNPGALVSERDMLAFSGAMRLYMPFALAAMEWTPGTDEQNREMTQRAWEAHMEAELDEELPLGATPRPTKAPLLPPVLIAWFGPTCVGAWPVDDTASFRAELKVRLLEYVDSDMARDATRHLKIYHVDSLRPL